MKRKTILLAIVVLSALIVSPAWKQQQDPKDYPAFVIKVVRNVSKSGPTAGWSQAMPLDKLAGGQQIRTDAKSFALIKFSDETKLVVRELTVVEIKGQIQGKQILDRNVHTTRGNVAFDVKKQEKEAFRFSSPISVASIRGTTGNFLRDEDDNTDYLGIGTGLATFLNLLSNLSLDVADGQTGTSDGDGNLDVHDSSDEEDALNDTDNAGFELTEGTHELRFGAEDREGNRKTIIIVWDE